MEPTQNIIFRDSNKHIAAISFSSSQAKSLKDAKEWKDLPNLAVITGLNGSGKSHLLEHTDHELSQKKRDINYPYRHIYLPSNHDDMSMSYQDASERKRQLINQLYYEINGKSLTDNTMLMSVGAKLTNGEFLRDHPNFSVEQFLQDLKNSPIREIDNNLDYQTLEQLVNKHLLYYVSGSRSINLLNAVLRDYNIKRDDYLSQNPEESELLGYVTDNRELFFPGRYPEDEAMRNDFDNIQDVVKVKYLEARISEELGDSPLKEINDILKKYQFNFELKENEKKGDLRQFWLQRLDVKGSLNLEPKDLSSGEKKILEMLAWFYYYSSQKPYDEKRVSIMLLDEPDRHLDPKLLVVFLQIICEEFVKIKDVQIIMTTHRPDTVKQVPEESLFLLERNGEAGFPEIIPVYKEHALYRLLKNLKELISIPIKVFTEDFDDVVFYSAIYHSLLGYSEEQRDKKRKSLIFKDQNGDFCPYQFLSRRYIQMFVSVSSEKGKGGCVKVLASLTLDKNIQKDFVARNDQEKRIIDPRIYSSLGIIDNDGKRETYLKNAEKEGLQNNTVIPKQSYSIENIELDPFIFCASLDPEKAGQSLNLTSKKDKNLKSDDLEESKESCQDETQEKVKKKFSQICKKINEEGEIIAKSPDIDIQNLQKTLQSYTDEYFEIMKSVIDQTQEQVKNKDVNAEAQISWEEKCDVNILILGGLNRIITLQYPKKFLKERGHSIFDKFIHRSERKNFANQVANGISQKKLKFIPQELAEVIFDLNDLAKKNCKGPKIRRVISTA